MKVLLTTLFMVLAITAQAAGLTVTNTAEIEVTEVDANGQEVIKRVPADKVIPGTQVIYTITANNEADKPLSNVVIANPVPEHMIYVQGSAKGLSNPAKTRIEYSVDGGSSYDIAEKLLVKGADGKERPATAEDYTHVRWVLAYPIPVGKQSEVSFRAQLK